MEMIPKELFAVFLTILSLKKLRETRKGENRRNKSHVLKKIGGKKAKIWQRTWEMQLDLQLIPLLFTEVSSEMVIVDGWLSRSSS